MDWADISTAGTVLFAFIAAILSLDKINDIISKRHTEPMITEREFKERTNERLDRGDKHMERQDEAIDLLIKGQLQVMNHMAYGNHSDELKKTITEYQDFLIRERES